MKHFIPIFIVVLLLTSIGIALAGNNPNLDEDANACFEGGTMEGKCNNVDIDLDGEVEEWEVEWHYVCGWYLIRFEYGLIDRENFPVGCDSLLPPIIVPAEAPILPEPEVTESPISELPR